MAYAIINGGIDPQRVYAAVGGLSALEAAGLPVE